MAATGLEAFMDPMADAQRQVSRDQLTGTLYGHNTNANIAYLQALAALQQQQLQNSGLMGVEGLRGKNTLQNTQTQGGFDLQRQGLVNQGQMDVAKQQAVAAQEIQRLVNSGQLDLASRQGQNAMQLAGINNQAQLQQILAQTGAQKDIAAGNNQTALQQAQLQLQGVLAPVEADRQKNDRVLGMMSPLLAQMFGLDASALTGGTQQQAGGNTLANASADDLTAALRARNAQSLPAPANQQEYMGREAFLGSKYGQPTATANLASQFGGSGLSPNAGGPRVQSNVTSQLRPGDPRLAAGAHPGKTAVDPFKNLMDGYFGGQATPAGYGNNINWSSGPNGKTLNTTGLNQPQAQAQWYQSNVANSGRPAAVPTGGTGGTGTNTGGAGNTGANGVPGGGTTNTSGSRGPRPTINTAPIYSQQMISQMGNRSDADAYRAEAGANRAATTRMGQAGFSTNSPAMASIANRNAIARSAQQQTGRFNVENEAAKANAGHQLAAQTAAATQWLGEGELDWRYFDTQNGGKSALLAALLGTLR